MLVCSIQSPPNILLYNIFFISVCRAIHIRFDLSNFFHYPHFSFHFVRSIVIISPVKSMMKNQNPGQERKSEQYYCFSFGFSIPFRRLHSTIKLDDVQGNEVQKTCIENFSNAAENLFWFFCCLRWPRTRWNSPTCVPHQIGSVAIKISNKGTLSAWFACNVVHSVWAWVSPSPFWSCKDLFDGGNG